MKEFIWKVCCLIWHFDDRVIREYEERLYQDYKRTEYYYWCLYQKKKEELDEIRNQKIPENYEYGYALSSAVTYQNFWNDIYDHLFELGYRLGKDNELNELRKNRK